MKSIDLFKKYKTSLDLIYQKQHDFDNKLKNFSELEEQINFLEKYFIELFDTSIQDMFFWEYCPFSVYENHYNNRLQEFKEKIPNSSELDFIELELNTINGSFFLRDEQGGIIDNNSPLIHEIELHLYYSLTFDVEILNSDLAKRIFIAQKRKIEFLKHKQQDISLPKNNETTTEDEFLEDLSNSTKAMQIVYLYELGILDFLQDKMNNDMIFSVNKLATVISSFTGIAPITVQPYLNPIYSKDAKQDKNPLKANNIKKVRAKLIELGFSIKETT